MKRVGEGDRAGRLLCGIAERAALLHHVPLANFRSRRPSPRTPWAVWLTDQWKSNGEQASSRQGNLRTVSKASRGWEGPVL
jgi:hypothetical protein